MALAAALASARDTKNLVVGSGVIARVAEVFAREFPGRRAVVVADPASLAAAGRAVIDRLSAAGFVGGKPFVFDEPNLPAEYSRVERLDAALRASDLIPVAVGSGTINDLVKLAASHVQRPYLCVATAASMDGYTAFGASITFQNAKQTFDCPAPLAVVADIDVIRRAPPEMTASGYADLQAKITAGADWILADALGLEPIDERAWTIVQGGLRTALADPAGARAGDAAAIARLTEGLLLGGFAMQWAKSSRPASGAEHQFSHLWDMEHHVHHGQPPSHGFKVGLATLAVTALYEQLLEQPLDRLDLAACCAQWPDEVGTAEVRAKELFARDDFQSTAIRETQAKHVSRAELARQLEKLQHVWPVLRDRLRAQLVSFSELKQRLQAVGAPTEPEAIGLTRERLRASFIRAQHIRRRFTVLDLAVRTGRLEACLAAIFGPGGIWPCGQ